jgi:hypothetical protein
MKRAAAVAVLAILALALLVYKHIIAATTLVIILGLVVATRILCFHLAEPEATIRSVKDCHHA